MGGGVGIVGGAWGGWKTTTNVIEKAMVSDHKFASK